MMQTWGFLNEPEMPLDLEFSEHSTYAGLAVGGALGDVDCPQYGQQAYSFLIG